MGAEKGFPAMLLACGELLLVAHFQRFPAPPKVILARRLPTLCHGSANVRTEVNTSLSSETGTARRGLGRRTIQHVGCDVAGETVGPEWRSFSD